MAESSRHRYWVGLTRKDDEASIRDYLEAIEAKFEFKQCERAAFALTLDLDDYETVVEPFSSEFVSIVIYFSTSDAIVMRMLDAPQSERL